MRGCKIDNWETNWGRVLTDLESSEEDSRLNKLFRLRFRIPYLIFKEFLVPMCKDSNIFSISEESKVRVPLEFKILMCLRILSRGNVPDDIAELSSGCPSTVNFIFKQFVTNFSKRFLSEFVKVHHGESEILMKNLYSALGLPGATGSMDCTHLWWNKCTESLKHLCKGKEKFPSLAFCALVDHFRYIQYISLAYFGASNDIQILEDDDFCRNLLNGGLKDYEYDMILDDGSKIRCKGGWIIVDGGMPQASVFINPMHERLSHDAIHWSEWLETIRKDVECTFGILKQRFRILLNRLEFHDRDIIESI